MTPESGYPKLPMIVLRIKSRFPNATTTLKASNLNVNITGTRGIVVSQEPIYDAEVDEGTVINVVIKEELRDTQ